MDPELFKDLSGKTIDDVIEVLQRLPMTAKCLPLHVCNTDEVFLHVSRDPATGYPTKVSLDYESLDHLYTNEDGEDERGEWR
ncbi:MAG: hypothetical protein NC489_08485 [Ruminococcus flavefaciens]|nr:hypothetical protein [Ruminococcus flavefaciens]